MLAESAATVDGPDGTLAELRAWLAGARDAPSVIEPVPLRALSAWGFDAAGNLRHATGRFFAVTGLRVRAAGTAARSAWDQPIIDQPEVGILGLLCQRRAGVLAFLVQAKAEPGNVGGVQLSPTLQATWSNYHQLHGGRTPLLLDEFLRPSGRVHVDVLQPEQGSRFLYKRNRNVVVELPDDRDLPVPDDFRWCTLGQLQALLAQPDVVNAECRSVLACLPGPADEPVPARDRAEVGHWLRTAAQEQDLRTERCDVDGLRGWEVDGWSIASPAAPFRIVGIRATLAGREVRTWDQPLVQPAATGLVGFLARTERDVVQLLVQARVEPGAPRPAVGPTVQASDPGAAAQPYLGWFHPTAAGRVRLRSLQSEEGGRFLRERHDHVVVDVGSASVPAGRTHRWMPIGHVRALVGQGRVNSQARSLLACLDAA